MATPLRPKSVGTRVKVNERGFVHVDEDLERFLARAGEDHSKPQRLQERLHGQSIAGIVVDHQQARRPLSDVFHGPPSAKVRLSNITVR